ncbi:alpha/beta hydrolase [Lachnospiraceae bacterium MD1]|uniref:prolyl aminopeptidase n=1 Tax=Variimorphobacter saccharofermentans TaxID=2755051 RepID=A0A839K4E9_9FIRM|nr:alpha/beta hydrolase [Variimorphobacter saccharofermentans]MBB2184227.1 alpha/beta hydrolase [Variimorphobacter saccharofermentans]
MNKIRKAIISSNEVSELKTYTLGGYSQKVLIEGKKKTNPIVIFLHGGPGAPIPFCEGCRGMFPELTGKVTMVYWDQLGCGINNHKIDDTFTVESFVKMTIDLIKNIRNDFKACTVNIFAVSWGSILAAKVAEAEPKLLHKVMVYGQVLKQLTFNDEVFEVLKNSSMPLKNKKRLTALKQSSERTLKELRMVMRWIGKYTEGYQAKDTEKSPIGAIIRGILTSPDYSLKDFIAIFANGYLKNTSLLYEVMNMDLSDTLKGIEIPYLILQGDTDIVTSTQMISRFVENAGNRNLSCIKVERSGHMPGSKGMESIINTGFEFLKK